MLQVGWELLPFEVHSASGPCYHHHHHRSLLCIVLQLFGVCVCISSCAGLGLDQGDVQWGCASNLGLPQLLQAGWWRGALVGCCSLLRMGFMPLATLLGSDPTEPHSLYFRLRYNKTTQKTGWLGHNRGESKQSWGRGEPELPPTGPWARTLWQWPPASGRWAGIILKMSPGCQPAAPRQDAVGGDDSACWHWLPF